MKLENLSIFIHVTFKRKYFKGYFESFYANHIFTAFFHFDNDK